METPKIEIIRRKFKRDGSDFWVRVSQTPKYDSVPELFKNVQEYLSKLNDEERTNLYYTQGYTTKDPDKEKNEHTRMYHGQNVVVWDIDHIPIENADKIIDKTCEVMGYDKLKTGIVKTGYGVQLTIAVIEKFMSNKTIKTAYKKKGQWLESKLRESGLFEGAPKANVDLSVIDPNKLARLGGTINYKPARLSAPSVFINTNIEPQFQSVEVLLNITTEKPLEKESTKKEKRILDIDEEAVKTHCGFLKYRLENVSDIHEPEARAVASILKTFKNGDDLAIDFFREVRDSGDSNTVAEFDDAEIFKRVAAIEGPYSCETIAALSDKCKGCPFKKAGCPVNIRSEKFAVNKARESGFRVPGTARNPIGRVLHDDLLKFYVSENNYFVSEISEHQKTFYQFNGKYFEELYKAPILNFAMKHVFPSPTRDEREEFFSRVALHNAVNINNLFYHKTEGHINFNNGILDVRGGKFLDHSHEYGFTYVLPYDYDPNADCPMWKKAIGEYMLGTEENIEILQMYGGYILAGGSCDAQAILILTGGGQNGKSVYWKLLGKILGWVQGAAFCTMKEPDFAKSHALAALRTKLMAVIEEPDPYTKSTFWEALKDYSAGGVISASLKFKNNIEFENRAKFVISMNQFSSGTAQTFGFIRRLKIVHFPHQIPDEQRIGAYEDVLLKAEGSGIVNWFIEGYRKLLKLDFKFPMNSQMKVTLEEYQTDTNMVFAFAKHIELEYGNPCDEGFATGNLNWHALLGEDKAGVFLDALYMSYNNFIKDQYGDDVSRVRREPKNHFSRKIRQIFPKSQLVKAGPRGSQKLVLTGLRAVQVDP
jgi:P4 family phage/plasmid primase-like protien